MKKYVIYKATNTMNQKVYVGFDSNWPRRKAQHKHNVIYGTETSNAFYNAVRKYGWENFVWEVIYESADGDHTLKVMENHFILEHNAYIYAENSNGYNMTLGGEGTVGHHKPKHSIDSQKEKMTGRKQSAEHIKRRTSARLSNPDNQSWHAGKTKETDPRIAAMALKVSESLKGKKKTESHKESMRLRPQDTTVLTCPHCSKVGDYKNMKRWHMDNCKTNPNLKTKESKKVTCNKCGHTTTESPNFYRYHNERCNNET
jgi:hypothetical protein